MNQRPPIPRPRERTRPHDPRRRARIRRRLRLARTIVVLAGLVALSAWGVGRCARPSDIRALRAMLPVAHLSSDADDGIKVGTFLGDGLRRSYGKGPVPDRLDLVWKARLGTGWTSQKGTERPVLWSGNGWTGQCTLVRDDGRLNLLVNAYDHGLHRIDAATGHEVWRYAFDDVVKATNTVFANPHPTGPDDRYIVTCGSRRGFPLAIGDPRVAPFRAIAFGSGRELWRLPVPRTANYSRDVDASGLLVDGKVLEAVEPGYVYLIDPDRTRSWSGFRTPAVVATSPLLYTTADVARHRGEPGGSNLAIEASPALLGGRIFIAAGSGHVFGLDRRTLRVVWDFYTGSDLDGTTVVTRDGKLLVSVERQYISGHGGVYLLDPSKPPARSVVWYYPTEDRGISEWAGGVIGSVGINDADDTDGSKPALAAFTSVDGKLYVVSQDATLAPRTATGPHRETGIPKPKLVASFEIGGGISTPAVLDDHIVATGYDAKVHVYRISYGAPGARAGGVRLKSRDGRSYDVRVAQVATFSTGAPLEATPLVWKGRVYVGCRNGWLYCLGDARFPEVERDVR